MLSCCLWIQFDDVRTIQSSKNICPHKGINFLIANFIEGIPVPLISPFTILEWNKYDSNEIAQILSFSYQFFYDDVYILLFVLKSKFDWFDVQTFAATYAFIVVRD